MEKLGKPLKNLQKISNKLYGNLGEIRKNFENKMQFSRNFGLK